MRKVLVAALFTVVFYFAATGLVGALAGVRAGSAAARAGGDFTVEDARAAGRSAGLRWALPILVGGLALAGFLSATELLPMSRSPIRCPACRERVRPRARTCKHCGSAIGEEVLAP